MTSPGVFELSGSIVFCDVSYLATIQTLSSRSNHCILFKPTCMYMYNLARSLRHIQQQDCDREASLFHCDVTGLYHNSKRTSLWQCLLAWRVTCLTPAWHGTGGGLRVLDASFTSANSAVGMDSDFLFRIVRFLFVLFASTTNVKLRLCCNISQSFSKRTCARSKIGVAHGF